MIKVALGIGQSRPCERKPRERKSECKRRDQSSEEHRKTHIPSGFPAAVDGSNPVPLPTSRSGPRATSLKRSMRRLCATDRGHQPNQQQFRHLCGAARDGCGPHLSYSSYSAIDHAKIIAP
jgi:hypothetical protein